MKMSPPRQLALLMLSIALLSVVALPVFAQSDPTPTPGGRSGGRTPLATPVGQDAGTIDMEDWVLLEGSGVSLMAPPEFEGGDIEEMLDILDTVEDVLGDEFAALIEIAQQNPDLYKLFAIAPTMMQDGVLTNINVTGTPLGMTVGMDTILDLLPASFPSTMEIIESEVITLGDYEEVGKILVEMDVMGLEQRIVMYAFLIDEDLYAIAFTSSADAHKDLAPVFEQMASTFEVTGE